MTSEPSEAGNGTDMTFLHHQNTRNLEIFHLHEYHVSYAPGYFALPVTTG